MSQRVSYGIAFALQTNRTTPNATLGHFCRATSVERASGARQLNESDTLSSSLFDSPPTLGKINPNPSFAFETTVRRGWAQQASAWPKYVNTYPLNPIGGVYVHRFEPTPDGADRKYWNAEIDRNGRVYSSSGLVTTGFTIAASNKFLTTGFDMAGRFFSHAQHFPTHTAGPFVGVVYTWGAPNDTDAAAVTYQVAVDVVGVIGAGLAKLKTKISTDAGFGTARLVYVGEDDPFELEDSTGAGSGIYLMLPAGTLDAADTWSISTRGTAAAASLPSNTVFSWNSWEFYTLKFNAATFRIKPRAFGMAYSSNADLEDHTGGSAARQDVPFGGKAKFTGTFACRVEDKQYMNAYLNNSTRTCELRARGQKIGATSYREEFGIYLGNIRVGEIREGHTQEREPVWTVPFTAYPQTDGGDDLGYLEYINSVATAWA